MAKNLDGIKKLSSDEVKKYRQVLNSIGEKAEPATEPKRTKPSFFARKSVDGLKVNKTDKLELAVKKQEEARRKIKAEERQYLLKKERQDKEKKLRERGRIMNERRMARQASEEAEAKVKLEETKRWEEKIKLEEKEQEEKRLAKENLRQEKIKRKAEVKRIKEEAWLVKKLAAAKRKIKRRQVFGKFKKNFKIKLSGIFIAVKKNFVYGLLLLIIFSAIGYLAFCLAILRFNTAGGLADKLTRYVPVPAVLSSYGFINYSDFKNLADKNYYARTLADKKKSLAEWIVIRNLKRKYNLPLDATAEGLALKFAADEDINRVGLSRIKKISQLLADGGDLASLSKYADEYNAAAYYGPSQAVEKFGQEVLTLPIGETSGVIYRGDGYYLVVRVNDQNNQFGFKYVFVSAQTLDQYLNEKLVEAKVFILAN